MENLISIIINESVVLSSTVLEHGHGSYLIVKSLTIAPQNGEWVYRVRHNGSPLSFENEIIDSWEFSSAEKAAKAAIEKFGIIAIRNGIAITKPAGKGCHYRSCHSCQWYLQSASFCAVNPCNLGNAIACPDFSQLSGKRVSKPIVPIKQLGKALIKCGLV